VGAGAAASFGEHEVAQPSVTGVGQRPLPAPTSDPGVEGGEGFGVERDHAFGAELADGDLEPGAVGAEVDETVQFEVQQFADAQPGGSQHDDGGGGEVVVEAVDGGHQVTVDSWWQGSWEGFGEAGQVGEEEQPAGRLAGPAPRRDVFEEHTQIDDVVVELGGRHGATAAVVAPARSGAGPGEERFDVSVAVELI